MKINRTKTLCKIGWHRWDKVGFISLPVESGKSKYLPYFTDEYSELARKSAVHLTPGDFVCMCCGAMKFLYTGQPL